MEALGLAGALRSLPLRNHFKEGMMQLLNIVRRGALAAGLLAGVAAPALAQELKVWELSSTSEGVNQNWKDVIAQFEAEHPGVTVKFETFDGESYKKGLAVALASNSGPDVYFNWGSEDSASLARNGLAADVSAMGTDRWLKNISEGMLGPFSVDGKAYGVPTHSIAVYMYYDTKFYADNNLTFPKTSDEMFAMCKAVREIDPDVAFTVLGNKDQWRGIHYVSMLTSQYVGPEKMLGDMRLLNDPETLFTDPGYVKALEFIAKMEKEQCFQSGVNATTADMSDAVFTSGGGTSDYCGTWCASAFDNQGMQGGYSIAPFPAISDAPAENQGYILGLTEGFQISEKSANKELAADFISLLLTPEVQAQRLVKAARIPLNGENVGKYASEVHPTIQAVVADLPNYKGFAPILDVDLNGKLVDIYKRGIQDVIDGRTSAADLMKTIHDEAVKIKAAM